MTGPAFAFIYTLLRPGAIKALSQIWNGSIDCDAAWTVWCAFLAGSYWGALSVAFFLLLDSRDQPKAASLDGSRVPLQPTHAVVAFSNHEFASSLHGQSPNPDTVAFAVVTR
jgi:hypothetical protein